MIVISGRVCRLNAYLHVQGGREGGLERGLKLRDLSVCTLWTSCLNSKVLRKLQKFFEITYTLKFIFNRSRRYKILYKTTG